MFFTHTHTHTHNDTITQSRHSWHIFALHIGFASSVACELPHHPARREWCTNMRSTRMISAITKKKNSNYTWCFISSSSMAIIPLYRMVHKTLSNFYTCLIFWVDIQSINHYAVSVEYDTARIHPTMVTRLAQHEKQPQKQTRTLARYMICVATKFLGRAAQSTDGAISCADSR